MKYRKILTILAVNIMVFSGMSAVASAGIFNRSVISKEINDEGTVNLIKYGLFSKEIFVINLEGPTDINSRFKGYYPVNLHSDFPEFEEDGLKVRFTGELDFPSIISRVGLPVFLKGYLPIKLTSIERIIDEPKLKFDVFLDESFLVEEPIPVKAKLENVGESTVIVDEINPVVSTLDLIIKTPDQREICYIGPKEKRLPEKIELAPGQKITYSFEDITVEDLFGYDKENSYLFITGEYSILGEYTSPIKDITSDDEKQEESKVFRSKKYNFEITDEIQETVTLTLATNPREIPDDVFTYTEPLELLPILDGKIHAVYKKDTEVTIKVDKIFEDFVFNRFEGAVQGQDQEVTVIMDVDKLVTAHYKKDGPEPIPPMACFTFKPKELIYVGTEIAFDSSCSVDPDGDTLSFLWDFGDGTSSEETNPTHSYEKSGEYTVSLIVKDLDGLSGRYSQNIKVIEKEFPETGIISGKISEASILEVVIEKKPVEGATIKAISTEKKGGNHYETTSDEKGKYKLPEVEVGEYYVFASKDGYIPAKPKIITVTAGECSEADFSLKKLGSDLEFDISLQATTFSKENPLSLTASLTNNEEESVEVSDIGIEYGTLQLQIKTPDNKYLITKARSMMIIPPKVEIGAGETYSVDINDLTVEDFIVILPVDGESSETYNFIPGEYVIKGIYTSFVPPGCRLVSPERTFVYK